MNEQLFTVCTFTSKLPYLPTCRKNYVLLRGSSTEETAFPYSFFINFLNYFFLSLSQPDIALFCLHCRHNLKLWFRSHKRRPRSTNSLLFVEVGVYHQRVIFILQNTWFAVILRKSFRKAEHLLLQSKTTRDKQPNPKPSQHKQKTET